MFPAYASLEYLLVTAADSFTAILTHAKAITLAVRRTCNLTAYRLMKFSSAQGSYIRQPSFYQARS
jgi:hypothetical protein